jgi:chitodextrinase
VTLSWRGSTDDVGVTAYRIYRRNSDGSWPIAPTASTAAATRSWTDTGRINGTTYSYRMTAVDAAGNESAPSATASATPQLAPDTTPPTTPTSFTATPQDTAVKLGWKGSVDDVGVTGYRIYRQDAAGAWPAVPTATTASATRSWTDSGLTNETTYTYRITAVDGAGNESQPSPSVSATPDVPDPQPSFPVRAAFVYAWYPEAWVQGGLNPYTHYHPSLGSYDSGSTSVIQNQVQAMQYGRISVGISSWWGQGDTKDARFATFLSTTAAMKSRFRWSIYYEPEGHGDPSVAQLTSDLAYIRDHYGSDRSYYRVGGRFVVFVYSSGADSCGMADRWAQANATINAYIVLKVFAGYRNCLNQPASWHQYAPATAASSQAGYSYTISPGFWKATEATPRLPRDLTRWTTNVQSMVGSRAPFQLITTFNEWGEGTATESAAEWASPSGFGAYLDALHDIG